MKKEVEMKSLAQEVYIHGFNEERFNSFLGRILTLIESMGVNQKQEEAIKSLIKQEVWGLWEHPAFIEKKDYNGNLVGKVI